LDLTPYLKPPLLCKMDIVTILVDSDGALERNERKYSTDMADDGMHQYFSRSTWLVSRIMIMCIGGSTLVLRMAHLYLTDNPARSDFRAKRYPEIDPHTIDGTIFSGL
jgi:hypothetical protein